MIDGQDGREFGATSDDSGLDRIDQQILLELQQDARLPNKTLAARVNLSESSCLARVRRLRQRGIITGFHAHRSHPTIAVRSSRSHLARADGDGLGWLARGAWTRAASKTACPVCMSPCRRGLRLAGPA